MFKNKSFGLLIRLIKNHRFLFIQALFFAFFVSILEGFSTSFVMLIFQILGGGTNNSKQLPIFIEKILDNLSNYFPAKWHLVVVITCFLALTIIKNTGLYFSQITSHTLQLKFGFSIRKYCIERFLQLEIPFYSQASVGELLSYVNEQTQRSENLSLYVIELVRECLAISVLFFVLVFLSPTLTIIAVIFLLIVAVLLKNVIKYVQLYGRKAAHDIDKFSSFIAELLNGIKLIKSFSAEHRESQRADKYLRSRYQAELAGFKYKSAIVPLTETAGITVLLLILAIGSVAMGDAGGATLPLLLTFTYTLIRMIPRINHLNSLRAQLASLSGSLDAVYNFLSSTDGLYLVDGSREYAGLVTGINFDNLTFRFSSNSEPTLKKVSFQVEKGKTTAIVGPSGSGKSTLVDLVMRFHDPESGSIQIDGIDIKEYQIASWRKCIAMVSQDTFLFNTSVRENIAYSSPNATELEIIEAAKKAYAYEFIQDLPQGLDTVVGERGTCLSGGQRQRIAIARAILRNPDVLILDEATSALDSNSEQIVQKAIEEVSRERTVIVIAHRLSTIEKADKIVVMNNGRVIEQGNHRELLTLQGQYWSLYKSQFSDSTLARSLK